MEQNLCAFEILLLNLSGGKYKSADQNQSIVSQDYVAIAVEILDKMLSHDPNLKNMIIYTTTMRTSSTTAPAAHSKRMVSEDVLVSVLLSTNHYSCLGWLVVHFGFTSTRSAQETF